MWNWNAEPKAQHFMPTVFFSPENQLMEKTVKILHTLGALTLWTVLIVYLKLCRVKGSVTVQCFLLCICVFTSALLAAISRYSFLGCTATRRTRQRSADSVFILEEREKDEEKESQNKDVCLCFVEAQPQIQTSHVQVWQPSRVL